MTHYVHPDRSQWWSVDTVTLRMFCYWRSGDLVCCIAAHPDSSKMMAKLKELLRDEPFRGFRASGRDLNWKLK